MRKIGEVIERKLQDRRLTRADLEKELGVSKATVSYWISGKKRPTYDRLEQIAGFLGCSVGELLGEQTPGLEDIESDRLRNVVGDLIAAHEFELRQEAQSSFLTSIEGIIASFRRVEAKKK